MKSWKELRIIFFGTPDFAVASLRALVDAGCNVIAVVTAPDKPAGRGLQLQPSAVKTFAAGANIPVLQPEKLKAEDFISTLRGLQADLQIVVAFRMLPEAVWAMPPMGTINVHASLLPQYRGAAPIHWAVINGERETGVTTFKIRHAIDTGNILLQEKVAIEPTDNTGTLYQKLMEGGAELLVRTVQELAAGTIMEQPQTTFAEGEIKHAPKIFKEDTLIDWNKPAAAVINLIRGLAPHPAAYTDLQEKVLKIYSAEAIETADMPMPGTMETDGKTYLRFAAINGWIYLKELQQEGKKRLSITDFLRGFRA